MSSRVILDIVMAERFATLLVYFRWVQHRLALKILNKDTRSLEPNTVFSVSRRLTHHRRVS
ncbi:hypothetical protein [Ruegeria conchae]|uniref:Uncharacterized protein n=1 Tax=Ruegeria conchae TaxID=981384 RepID=A0A497ZY47_9RHOB|nr:hypothetical protein [Ruegeria conchae]RLK07927.1 hypothetical protein CLV75_1591 [Ruegeria conchae]